MHQPSHVVHFTDIEKVLRQELLKAEKSVRVCVAWINYARFKDVFTALVSRKVSIDVIINDDTTNRKNFPQDVPGMGVRRVNSKSGILHNKFCVVDEHVVLSGSYNWSVKAKDHYEQLEVSKHNYVLASDYIARFDTLWNVAEAGVLPSLRCEFKSTGKKCTAGAFNLGIIGEAEGRYETSSLAVWRVCFKHSHASFIEERFEHHIMERLGLYIESDPEWEDYLTEAELLAARRRATQRAAASARDFFKTVADRPVHAIGHVVVLNNLGHMQFREEPTYGIRIRWKDAWYEHLIANEFEQNDDGIEDIVSSVRG